MKTTCPSEYTRGILRQLVIFQMTYLGAPMIYYGTEVGMWGANDPDNRQPMLWDDVDYEPETHTPTGRCPAAERKPDPALFSFCKRAIALRKAHPALRRGTVTWIRCANQRVLAFERRCEDEALVAVFNASDEETTPDFDVSGTDTWSGESCLRGMPLTVPPRGWRVIKTDG